MSLKGRSFGNEISPTSETYLTIITGLAMFHQMHCIQTLRNNIVGAPVNHHTRHCLNVLRQAVLCGSDITLDAINKPNGTNGLGMVHVCRDWRKVYDFVAKNQLIWHDRNVTKGPDV
jgi:hypothetical protein